VPVSDPAWLATFRCQRRSTDVYRRGRVMLAGDAVHIHSPAGGQGMNTGIMDAHNLAWKLALVTSGRSPDGLLDSYGQERGPVAADVLALTHSLVTLGTMTHPVRRALRNLIVPLAGHVAPVQRRAVRRMGHIHVAYPSSPLTQRRRSQGNVQPGDRAPDVDVTGRDGPTRLYEVLRHGRHVVTIVGADHGGELLSRLSPWQDLVDVVTTANGRSALGPAGGAFLLRPDGYVAACGSVARCERLADYLGQVFGCRGTRQHDPAHHRRRPMPSGQSARDDPATPPRS
jgi:hypothetical protein